MGKAVKRAPATLWKEAHHVNPWLASEEGREALGETLPSRWRIVSAEHQQVAGDLFVDVLGKTATGETVIIEAQLGQSNHDHLGKLITYAAIYDAACAIWIVNEARTEHQEALNFLNESVNTEFFLVKLEAVVVGSSPPAPLLTMLSGPAPAIKKAGEVKADLKRRDALRIAFWTAFLPEAKGVHERFAARKPRPTSRVGVPSGRVGIRYVVGLRQHSCTAELLILPGAHQKFGDPLVAFREIEARKAQIEAAVARPTEWVQSTRPRLRITVGGAGYEDEQKWPAAQKSLLSALDALIKSTSDVLAHLASRPAVAPIADADDDQDELEDEEEEANG